MRTLPRIVAETEIGHEVPVVVWRDGQEMTLTAMVGELPDEQKVADRRARQAGAGAADRAVRPRAEAVADHAGCARPLPARRRTRRAC